MFTVLTFKLLFLFFPEILGTMILILFNEMEEKDALYKWFISSFFIGTISYFILSWKYNVTILTLSSTSNTDIIINPKEVLLATVLAIIISISWIFLKKLEFIHHLARKIGISNSIGFDSIVDTIYNSFDKKIKDIRARWVRIQHYNSNLSFRGQVLVYDFHKKSSYLELLLTDVKIFKDDKIIRDRKYLYLNLDPNNIFIEYYYKEVK